MHKVILIILATAVNGLAVGYDKSKLADDCLFVFENQLNTDCGVVLKKYKGNQWYGKNAVPNVLMDYEPSWKLFANFNPIAFQTSLTLK